MKVKRKTDSKLLAAIRTQPCAHCEKPAEHAHHVKTRGSGGGDTADNVMPLCAEGHMQIHAKGSYFMSLFYAGVNEWLVDHGWTLSGTRWRKP